MLLLVGWGPTGGGSSFCLFCGYRVPLGAARRVVVGQNFILFFCYITFVNSWLLCVLQPPQHVARMVAALKVAKIENITLIGDRRGAAYALLGEQYLYQATRACTYYVPLINIGVLHVRWYLSAACNNTSSASQLALTPTAPGSYYSVNTTHNFIHGAKLLHILRI